MRTLLLAAALVCACAAVPAFAADKAESDQAQSAQPADNHAAPAEDKNRKVCKVEVSTGSVMPKRVCRTVAEIEALQEQAAKAKEGMRH